MAQRLDRATASELISELDERFRGLRRDSSPPYEPSERQPWPWKRQLLDRDGFQDIADEMRLYLGLSRGIRVRLLSTAFDHERGGTGLGGMQWTEDPWRSDIVLSCRPHMETVNLVAALAHEMTHVFLEYKGLRAENEERNELLTEAAAIYLGMGWLLRAGYAQISWKETRPSSTPGYLLETVTHTTSLGYIDTASVRLLMVLSSRCSGCHYGSRIAHAGTRLRRASRHAWRNGVLRPFQRRNERRSAAHGAMTARIAQNIENLGRLYAELDETFASQSFLARASGLAGPEWLEVGRVYGLYASGRLKSEVNETGLRVFRLQSNTRWNAHEAKVLDTDVSKETELLEHVLRFLSQHDRR